jgi:hypothetical protein
MNKKNQVQDPEPDTGCALPGLMNAGVGWPKMWNLTNFQNVNKSGTI